VSQKVYSFTCIQCDLVFSEQFQLRAHMNIKHVVRIEPKEINCEFCSIKFSSNGLLKEHQKECNTEFQPIRSQVCRYFLHGACVKGEFCKFAHPDSQDNVPWVPLCRNGQRCKYLNQGVCSFFHKGIGVQMPKSSNNQRWNPPAQQPAGRPWCKFLEDCNQVPHCSFLHAEEDFPQLNKTNNPPIPKNIPGWWAEY
jgi:hypothetical protein